VFKSTNSGGSWSAANAGLSYAWARSLALSPDYASNGTLYMGNSPVFVSTDRAGSWAALGTAPWRRYAVVLISVPGSPKSLFVGTDGQSIWRYDLP